MSESDRERAHRSRLKQSDDEATMSNMPETNNIRTETSYDTTGIRSQDETGTRARATNERKMTGGANHIRSPTTIFTQNEVHLGTINPELEDALNRFAETDTLTGEAISLPATQYQALRRGHMEFIWSTATSIDEQISLLHSKWRRLTLPQVIRHVMEDMGQEDRKPDSIVALRNLPSSLNPYERRVINRSNEGIVRRLMSLMDTMNAGKENSTGAILAAQEIAHKKNIMATLKPLTVITGNSYTSTMSGQIHSRNWDEAFRLLPPCQDNSIWSVKSKYELYQTAFGWARHNDTCQSRTECHCHWMSVRNAAVILYLTCRHRITQAVYMPIPMPFSTLLEYGTSQKTPYLTSRNGDNCPSIIPIKSSIFMMKEDVLHDTRVRADRHLFYPDPSGTIFQQGTQNISMTLLKTETDDKTLRAMETIQQLTRTIIIQIKGLQDQTDITVRYHLDRLMHTSAAAMKEEGNCYRTLGLVAIRFLMKSYIFLLHMANALEATTTIKRQPLGFRRWTTMMNETTFGPRLSSTLSILEQMAKRYDEWFITLKNMKHYKALAIMLPTQYVLNTLEPDYDTLDETTLMKIANSMYSQRETYRFRFRHLFEEAERQTYNAAERVNELEETLDPLVTSRSHWELMAYFKRLNNLVSKDNLQVTLTFTLCLCKDCTGEQECRLKMLADPYPERKPRRTTDWSDSIPQHDGADTPPTSPTPSSPDNSGDEETMDETDATPKIAPGLAGALQRYKKSYATCRLQYATEE